MTSSSSAALLLSLGVASLGACGEDRIPTQPETSGTEAVPAPAAAAFVSNTWTLKAAPPNFLFVNQLSAGAVPDASGQSVVYLLGGRDDDGGCGASIATYRIGTNTWSVKSMEPRVQVFNSNGVGRIGNTLYISGGESFCGGSFFIDGGFAAYDPATNTLTEKPTPPKLTSEGVTGVIDGKLFVLPGLCSFDFFPNPGYCEDQPFRRLFRYNPATNLWATKRPAPHFHTYGAGGAIGGKFYVAGGDNTTDLDRYDPATDTWTTLAPLPLAGTVRGTAFQGKLFVVVSNYNSATGTTARRMYVYDPGTNAWTRKAAPRYDHPEYVPITWGGKPFLLGVGGLHFDPGTLTNPTEVYAP